ncbi:MAG: Ig-like domain-containing protein, partial [Pirellulaceae bacterium]
DTGTVSITVDGVNDPPVAVDDTGDTFSDTAISINILANDTDPESDDLTVVIDTTNTRGNVTLNADNTVTYDPTGIFDLTSGQQDFDSFTYTIDDGNGGVDVAVVLITVTGPNNPPEANDDSAVTTEESSVTVNVLSNDIEPDGQQMTIDSFDTTGTLGQVTLNADQTFTYSPDGQFEALGVSETAQDTFTYTVKDEVGDTATATVTITVNGLNDIPNAVDDGYSTVQGATFIASDADGNSTPTILNDNGVLANDNDLDGDTLNVFVIVQPTHAAFFELRPDGTFTYAHDGSVDFTDTFVYQVEDGNGGAATGVVTITLTPRPPSAWQNLQNPLDVNADGFISPIDALLIINSLNRGGARELPVPVVPPNAPPPFYDVNGDGFISPADALQVINYVNDQGSPEGEFGGGGSQALLTLGEGEGSIPAGASQFVTLQDSAGYGQALADYVLRNERSSVEGVHAASLSGLPAVSSDDRSPARETNELDAIFASVDSEPTLDDEILDALFEGYGADDVFGDADLLS